MGLREKLIATEEALREHCRIIIQDDDCLYIENCRCVKEYTDSFITLSSRRMDIKVVGSPLTLESVGADGVKISGKIHSLTLEEH